MKISEQLQRYLEHVRDTKEFGGDQLSRILDRGTDLELQINTYEGEDGRPLIGRAGRFENDQWDWGHIRIPRDAATDPHWTDYNIEWPLGMYCKEIGSTGWDWKNQQSLWCGFDFDSIVGHAEGVGVSPEELKRVETAAFALPYVEARRSTSGTGLHLIAMLDGIETRNHAEHAAVARAALAKMGRDAGYDFTKAVDVVGVVLWFYSKRATDENRGFELLKSAETCLTFEDVSNWSDHLDVVHNRKTSVPAIGVTESQQEYLERVCSGNSRVNRDDKHMEIEAALKEISTCQWDASRHMWHLKTRALQDIMQKCDIQGVFETLSPGDNMNMPNAFAFPGENGSMRVIRFGKGTVESPIWSQDGEGWTSCWYNRAPDFDTAAKHSGAVLLDAGDYECATLADAVRILKLLTEREFDFDPRLMGQLTVIKKPSQGRVSLQIKAFPNEPAPEGWSSTDVRGKWVRQIDLNTGDAPIDVVDFDDIIRCLRGPCGNPMGWVARIQNGEWANKRATSIKLVLKYRGHSNADADVIMGRCEFTPWNLVNRPFQEEYPGDRVWNYRAVQLTVQPALQPGPHPTWDSVLGHVGAELDEVLPELTWARQAGVLTGAQYLMAWIASMILYPLQHTPYLFLHGPENSGKSSLHECIRELMKDKHGVCRGVVKADKVLSNQSDFNGELVDAVLAVVEEKNLSSSKGALAKIKDYITSPTVSIRKMYTDSYEQPNHTHWIQCANEISACPVFPGDSRITTLYVAPFQGEEIGKDILMQRIREEAPNFLRSVFDLKLPEPTTDRLRIPVVETQSKREAIHGNSNLLEQFIEENVLFKPDASVSFSQFFEAFNKWLPDDVSRWTKMKVSRQLPREFTRGKDSNNNVVLQNMELV